MNKLNTLEEHLELLKEYSKNTIRATHSIYYSKEKKKWVVNLTNKREVFNGETALEAVEAACVFIKYNRKLNKNGEYSL